MTQGTELLVWYGESYLQFMDIPIAIKDTEATTASENADSKYQIWTPIEICMIAFYSPKMSASFINTFKM